MKNILKLILCFILCLGAGLIFASCGVRDDEKVGPLRYTIQFDFGIDEVKDNSFDVDIEMQKVEDGVYLATEIEAKDVPSVKAGVNGFLGWYYKNKPERKVQVDDEGDLYIDVKTVSVDGSENGTIEIFAKFDINDGNIEPGVYSEAGTTVMEWASFVNTFRGSDGVTKVGKDGGRSGYYYKINGKVSGDEPCTFAELTEIKDKDGKYPYKKAAVLVLPAVIYNINTNAFAHCSWLKQITISGVTDESVSIKIEADAFRDCSNLEKIVITDNGNKTNYKVKGNCLLEKQSDGSNKVIYGYKNFVIPDDENITSIAASAFYGNTSVSKVSIPETCEVIGAYAFKNCSNLMIANISVAATSIGKGVFEGCSSITQITFDNPNGWESNGKVFEGTDLFYSTLAVQFLTQDYLNYSWKMKTENYLNVAEGVITSVKNRDRLAGCLVIPGNVTRINENVFFNCKNLTGVYFLERKIIGLFTIEKNAFWGCSNLRKVSAKSLGDWMKISFANENANPISYAGDLFIGGELLTALTITGAVNDYAFFNCTSLTALNVKLSVVESLGAYCFANCSSLDHVYFMGYANGERTIGKGAFFNCTGLNIVDYTQDSEKTDLYWYIRELKFSDMYSNPLYYAHRLVLYGGHDNADYIVRGGIVYIKDASIINPHAFVNCEEIQGVSDNSAYDDGGEFYPFTMISCGEDEFWSANQVLSIGVGMSVGAAVGTFLGPLGTAAGTIIGGAVALIANLFIGKQGRDANYMKEIDKFAFYGCSNLQYVKLDKEVKIGDNAFLGCNSLHTIGFGENEDTGEKDANGRSIYRVTKTGITYKVENNCLIKTPPKDQPQELVLAINRDPNKTDTGTDAKEYIYKASDIPKGVNKIHQNAFNGCTFVEDEIEIPVTIKFIGSGAFANTKTASGKLVRFTFKNENGWEFRGEEIDPNEVVEVVEDQEINNFSSKVNEVGDWDFNYEYYLDFTYDSDLGGYVVTKDANLQAGDIEGWIDIPETWSGTNGTKEVRAIGYAAFAGCSALEIISLPSTIKQIGQYAFSDCTSLRKVVFGSALQEIKTSAFMNCTSLQTVDMSGAKNLKTIGELAFYGCRNITDIEIGQKVNEIGRYAFGWCRNLVSVGFLGDDLETIGEYAFAYCSSLRSIIIPNNVNEINQFTFEGCSALRKVVIGSNVEAIWAYAFTSCHSLTEVDMSHADDLEIIGTHAFNDCINLRGINIGKEVDVIGDYAFSGCENLVSISFLGDDLETIGACAFQDCSNLAGITITEDVEEIGTNAFSGCNNLKNVYIISEDVGEALTDADSYGGLIKYAKILYLEEDIDETDYIKNNFTKSSEDTYTIGGEDYYRWTRNATA